MTTMHKPLASGLLFRAALGVLAAVFLARGVAAHSETSAPIPLGVSVDAAKKSGLGATGITTENDTGATLGDYIVKQTAEMGGRTTSFTGNEGMWDSLVDLGTGPRLLEYSLNLHSTTRKALLFDNRSFNNFGYGGDPNDDTRLQFSKSLIYDFDGYFRRDRNAFNYNLLANPLNPPTSVPTSRISIRRTRSISRAK